MGRSFEESTHGSAGITSPGETSCQRPRGLYREPVPCRRKGLATGRRCDHDGLDDHGGSLGVGRSRRPLGGGRRSRPGRPPRL